MDIRDIVELILAIAFLCILGCIAFSIGVLAATIGAGMGALALAIDGLSGAVKDFKIGPLRVEQPLKVEGFDHGRLQVEIENKQPLKVGRLQVEIENKQPLKVEGSFDHGRLQVEVIENPRVPVPTSNSRKNS